MARFESIDAWIDRQNWPDTVKAEAHEAHAARARARLNPMTGSAWRAWANARGVTW